MVKRKEISLPYRRIPNNRCRRNKGNRKSLLEHHSNTCCRQGPLKNAILSGQNFKE